MRTKSKVAKKRNIPPWVYLSLGYAIVALLALLHLSAFVLKFHELSKLFPAYSTTPWHELAVLLGGPVAILLSIAVSFKKRKLAGALLLLGAALFSAGIAFQSGYFLKTYLLRMASLGLPQIIAGICFLRSGKTEKTRNDWM